MNRDRFSRAEPHLNAAVTTQYPMPLSHGVNPQPQQFGQPQPAACAICDLRFEIWNQAQRGACFCVDTLTRSSTASLVKNARTSAPVADAIKRGSRNRANRHAQPR